MTSNVLIMVIFALCSLASYPHNAAAQMMVVIPHVTFFDSDGKNFNLNQQLALHFESDVPKTKLRVRAFRGSKADLIAGAKKAPARSCIEYPSFPVGFAGQNGAAKFYWFFNASNLKVNSAENGFENQVYTLVLESTDRPPVSDWRMSASNVDNYFNNGLEIVVVADEPLKSGVESEVKKVVQKSAPRASSIASTGKAAIANQGEPCIAIRTIRALGSDTAQLIGERCPAPPS